MNNCLLYSRHVKHEVRSKCLSWSLFMEANCFLSLSTASERVSPVPIHEEVGDDEIENIAATLPATTTTQEITDTLPEAQQATFASLCETFEKPPTMRDTGP